MLTSKIRIGEKFRLFLWWSSVLFAIFMMSYSYLVYVLLCPQVTARDRVMLIEYIQYLVFYYFWIVYIYFSVRHGIWKKSSTFPAVVKRGLVLLFIVSIVWMFLVEVVSWQFTHLTIKFSPLLVWLFDAVYYVPFLFPWIFLGAHRPSSLRSNDAVD